MQLGFSTLRELVVLRPSVRPAALDVLLGLTTHADKRVRNAAIMTVKKWVPDMRELTPVVHAFALELVERLKVAPPPPPSDEAAAKEGEDGEGGKDKDGEEDMKVDGATPPPDEPKDPWALVRGGKVVDRLDPPTTIGGVTQHVELLLALCVKEPALLFPCVHLPLSLSPRALGPRADARPSRRLFERYGAMQPFAQDALEELIAPLIRSLGLKHEGLLDLVGRFPAGSDKLMFRVLEIAADKSKLPSNVTGLIRQVAAERELDQRFYPIILPECSKVRSSPSPLSLSPSSSRPDSVLVISQAEVVRWLPHVIKLLDGTPLKKAQTRSIFLSIIAPPAHFSSINSLRTRSDSITPVELMMYLHKHDKEMGLKNTIEGASLVLLLLSLPRADALLPRAQPSRSASRWPTASAPRSSPPSCSKPSTSPSSRISSSAPCVPLSPLSSLSLRFSLTLSHAQVIQAVTTYKSLQPFVSTTLLSRLIAKKVWTVGPLWEGFVRLAKAIAPNSFAALLQLPKEQLAEVVVKQPSLRAPLREYVVKSASSSLSLSFPPLLLRSSALTDAANFSQREAPIMLAARPCSRRSARTTWPQGPQGVRAARRPSRAARRPCRHRCRPSCTRRDAVLYRACRSRSVSSSPSSRAREELLRRCCSSRSLALSLSLSLYDGRFDKRFILRLLCYEGRNVPRTRSMFSCLASDSYSWALTRG